MSGFFALAASAATQAVADTVAVGSPITPTFFTEDFTGNSTETTTIANVSLGEAGSHATSPVAGTIVQWRVDTYGIGQYAIRVLRPASSGQFTGVGTSAQTVVTPGDHTFSANLPIQAGDLIGLDMPISNGIEGGVHGAYQIAGSEADQAFPAILDGTPTAFDDTNGGAEAWFNAVVQFTPSPDPSPGSTGTAAKCKKKKKHKRSASAAKKCKKKKGKK